MAARRQPAGRRSLQLLCRLEGCGLDVPVVSDSVFDLISWDTVAPGVSHPALSPSSVATGSDGRKVDASGRAVPANASQTAGGRLLEMTIQQQVLTQSSMGLIGLDSFADDKCVYELCCRCV